MEKSLSNEDIAQKVSFELDSLINKLLKPGEDANQVQRMMVNNYRLTVYKQVVTPIVKQIQQEGPEKAFSMIEEARQTCERILSLR